MKKILVSFAIIALIFLVSVGIIYASYTNFANLALTGVDTATGTISGGIFGGKITKTKATEIQDKEDEGYSCDLNSGTSIVIKPIKGPKTYMIPSGTKSKTGKTVASNKWIMGKYSGKTTITCKKECQEEDVDCVPEVDVKLNEITLFGTS